MKESFTEKNKKIQELVDEVVFKHNENERKINILKNSLREFDESKIDETIDNCKYRIYILENPYNSSARQDDMDENTNYLKNELSILTEKVEKLQEIKKNVNVEFDDKEFDNISITLVSSIDEYSASANETIKKANSVLNHEFGYEETVKEEKNIEEVVEEEKTPVENTPVIEEAKIDELDELSNTLENELQPIQEDKKMLEDFSNSLNENTPIEESVKVDSVEEVTPVLGGKPEMDLDTYLDYAPKTDEVVKEETPVVNETPSAASVVDGEVKVVSIEPAFSYESSNENTVEDDAKVLGRAA